MSRWLSRLLRGRPPTEPPIDPTRPHYVERDGVPIIHEGPPGFPGRPETGDETEDGIDDAEGDR